MNKEELKLRTKNFALRIIKLANALPNRTDALIIKKQIIRSATSVASNYRSACRGRSTNEFLAKLSIIIEESDETSFWLEIIFETQLIERNLLHSIINEANEITAIMVSSRITASKKNLKSTI